MYGPQASARIAQKWPGVRGGIRFPGYLRTPMDPSGLECNLAGVGRTRPAQGTALGYMKEGSRVTEHLEIALAIYRTMWDYYVQTIRNRAQLLDWYFRIVALPAAAVAIVAASDAVQFPCAAVAALLFAIYVAGVSTVVAYAKMSRNSYAYYKRTQQMEAVLVQAAPELSKYGRLFDIRGEKGKKLGELRLGSINGWRIAAVVAINTAIGGAAAGLAAWPWRHDAGWSWVALSVVVSVLIHVVLYVAMHGPLGDADDPAAVDNASGAVDSADD